MKRITIDLEAYELLAADRRKGESFSQVIKRRLRPARTTRTLLENLGKLTLSEETLDHVDELIRARGEHLARAPVVDLEG